MNMDMKDIFRHRIGSISLILSLLTMALASQSVMAQDPINLSNVKFEIVCEDTVEMGKKSISDMYWITATSSIPSSLN